MPDLCVLIDGHSLMYRAFHALPLLDDGHGNYTNAAYGFLSMLLKILSDKSPAYCAVAFDLSGPTFRHDSFEAYKANRPPTPEELRPQFPLVRELLDAMHIPVVTSQGYEGDDVLGTLARMGSAQGADCLIVTGDRDALQLVNERTQVLYTKRGISDTILHTPESVLAQYGVTPGQVADMKGLMGDSSDNIPGIPGVGEKTAAKLLAEFGSLENVLENAEHALKGKMRERVLEGAEQARISKQLATIDTHVPLEIALSDLKVGEVADALPLFEQRGFKSLIARLSALRHSQDAPAPQAQAEREDSLARELSDMDQVLAAVKPLSGKDLGIALSGTVLSLCAAGEAPVYVRFSGGDLLNPGMDPSEVLLKLAPLFSSETRKTVYDVKGLLGVFGRYGLALCGEVDDVMLAAYVLSPQRGSFALPRLCEEEGVSHSEEEASRAVLQLKEAYLPQISRQGMHILYAQVEMPLARVLFDMERQGFLVDEGELRRLGEGYTAQIEELKNQVYEHAGQPFNLNSPKQLGEVLFDNLGLQVIKKTRTGRSTDAEVLEQLADKHPIIPPILTYRKLAKLQGTYIEGLLRLVGKDGRIHTSFDQVSTATGRISSQEPNLQNIPVRSDLGREIRRAFVARPGYVLVDADYSQIELRVLAHMSGDEAMIDAFRRGQDIHQRTAAEVYGVPLQEVTPAMRSAAKAVNFGIVYGISDFGLARNIGIGRKEAAQFIERYLDRYPGVKGFMDGAVAQGKAQGYVVTLLGRRRYLPELASSNHSVRSFGERVAMNSPIQGTAADIIKLAMVRVSQALKEGGFQARLILQVHDELIVETPEAEAAQVARLVKESMEKVLELSVPIVAEVEWGQSWYDSK